MCDLAAMQGALTRTTADSSRTIHVSIQDATATKVDYFIRPTIRIDARVTPAGRTVLRTTVTIMNTALPGAAPSYALGPNTSFTQRPGQYIGRVYFWGPRDGSQLDSIEESGLRLTQKPIAVDPGKTTVVTFDTVLPARPGAEELVLRVVPQPRHVPVPVTAELLSVGGVTRGEVQRVPGGKDSEMRWKL